MAIVCSKNGWKFHKGWRFIFIRWFDIRAGVSGVFCADCHCWLVELVGSFQFILAALYLSHIFLVWNIQRTMLWQWFAHNKRLEFLIQSRINTIGSDLLQIMDHHFACQSDNADPKWHFISFVFDPLKMICAHQTAQAINLNTHKIR